MREIKFRAWDEAVMHNNFQFIKSGDAGNDWIVFTSDKQTLESKPHPFENPFFSQQLKIMQYTGLKDKNGKEIYEGDIILQKYKSKLFAEQIYVFPVIFKDCSFGLDMITEQGKNLLWPLQCNYGVVENEVIGDIYYNPELLEISEKKD